MASRTDAHRALLQQSLPFTVLKHWISLSSFAYANVATVLTVYGIETVTEFYFFNGNVDMVATVLIVYGIETCYES